MLLAYEKQMIEWSDRRAASIQAPSPGLSHASISLVLANVRAAAPDATVTTFNRRADPAEAAARNPGEARPPQQAPAAVTLERLDEQWAEIERQTQRWRTISLRVPVQQDSPRVFTVDRGLPGQPQERLTLTVDATTDAIVRVESFDDLTRGRQWRSMLRFAHTGEVGGLTGQTMAGVASAAGCVLVYTGFALACSFDLAPSKTHVET